MENSQIITWVLGGICGVVFWLVISNSKQSQKLAVIETKVDSLKTTLELFLKSEIDILKEFISKK
jgi:hypothetical protein